MKTEVKRNLSLSVELENIKSAKELLDKIEVLQDEFEITLQIDLAGPPIIISDSSIGPIRSTGYPVKRKVSQD